MKGKLLSFNYLAGKALLGGMMMLSAGLAQAATVAVDTLDVLFVDFSINISGLGNFQFAQGNISGVQIDMGTYQDPIVSVSETVGSNTFSATLFSTPDFGDPAPSATIDTVANTVSADFSSLYLAVDLGPNFMFVMTAPVSVVDGTYNPANNLAWLSWTETMTYTDPSGQEWTITLDALVDGKLTPVPVPAAAWLFGSGLLGLIGVARRRARL